MLTERTRESIDRLKLLDNLTDNMAEFLKQEYSDDVTRPTNVVIDHAADMIYFVKPLLLLWLIMHSYEKAEALRYAAGWATLYYILALIASAIFVTMLNNDAYKPEIPSDIVLWWMWDVPRPMVRGVHQMAQLASVCLLVYNRLFIFAAVIFVLMAGTLIFRLLADKILLQNIAKAYTRETKTLETEIPADV